MRIQPLRLAGAAAALIGLAAQAMAMQSGQDTGGPIATQASVSTPPAAPPAANTGVAAALRAAVLPPKPAEAAAPTPAASAPPTPFAPPAAPAAPPSSTTPPAAAAPIATLPTTTTASAPASIPTTAGGSSVYGDAAALQPTALAPGLTVKDRTGATIGQVASIDDDPKNGQLVTVQMGQESFRLRADRFGLWGGAATINLTQADIEAQLHPKRR